MALKDDWKNFGKNVGGTAKSLGKSIVKTVKVGAEKLDFEEQDENKPTGLKESWSEVGHSFGKTGKSLGKAISGTAKKAVGEYDDAPECETGTCNGTAEESGEECAKTTD